MANKARGNLAVLTGALFVVLFIAGIVVQDSAAKGAVYPMTTDGADKVQAYFQATTATNFVGGLHILSAFALGWFALTLVGVIRRYGKPDTGAGTVALAGGLVSASFQALSGVCLLALDNADIVADAGLAKALYQLSFWTGGPLNVVGFGALVAATGYALLGVTLPKWLNIFGIVIGTIGTLAVLSVVVWPAVAATPLGRYIGFIWVLITSIMLALKKAPAAAVPAEAKVAEKEKV